MGKNIQNIPLSFEFSFFRKKEVTKVTIITEEIALETGFSNVILISSFCKSALKNRSVAKTLFRTSNTFLNRSVDLEQPQLRGTYVQLLTLALIRITNIPHDDDFLVANDLHEPTEF